MKPQSWLKEPLVHFLLAGAAMFGAVSLWSGPAQGDRTIRLDREDLLVFLQGRAQVFDEKTFSTLLDRMSAEDRGQLVHDAALQEALYREGQALDLAAADPLIRQRIVQQMRVLLMEEAAADTSVSDAELRAYYDAHREDYRRPPQATFTHVFFGDAGGARRAHTAAEEELAELRSGGVPFENAGEHGERFLYQLNYVDVGPALVASHFGEAFARRLFELESGAWQGPVRSEHGWHLVLLSRREPARQLTPADLGEQLREDALADKRTRLGTAALDRMLARYEIVAPDLND